ncbi:MAG: copper resistance protein NlpE [Ferruginibacter sp.]
MKTHHTILFVALSLMTGCNNRPNTKKEDASVEVHFLLPPTDTAIATGDNSFNALDWPGTYTGIVPCADCDGIETSITLNKDLIYAIKTTYLGKNKTAVIEKKGSFIWNKKGNIITWDNVKSAPSKYLVGENKLIQLDINGKRMEGSLAAKYVLKKM